MAKITITTSDKVQANFIAMMLEDGTLQEKLNEILQAKKMAVKKFDEDGVSVNYDSDEFNPHHKLEL